MRHSVKSPTFGLTSFDIQLQSLTIKSQERNKAMNLIRHLASKTHSIWNICRIRLDLSLWSSGTPYTSISSRSNSVCHTFLPRFLSVMPSCRRGMQALDSDGCALSLLGMLTHLNLSYGFINVLRNLFLSGFFSGEDRHSENCKGVRDFRAV